MSTGTPDLDRAFFVPNEYSTMKMIGMTKNAKYHTIDGKASPHLGARHLRRSSGGVAIDMSSCRGDQPAALALTLLRMSTVRPCAELTAPVCMVATCSSLKKIMS